MPTSTDRVLGSSNNQYNAVFTDKKDNAEMDQMDFMKLMVAQMQNQDFTNPMDNSQMVEQMASFSNMQMMQQMASYAKTNHAMSLVGKTVTASRFGVGGNLDTTTGVVGKVTLVDNEYVVYVNDKKYTLEQIMSVENGSTVGGGNGENNSGSSTVNPKNFELKTTDVKDTSVTVKWQVPTEDEKTAAGLKYTVYYSLEKGFDTVEDVEMGSQAGGKDLPSITEASISDLSPNTTYYINVLVTDAKGNKSVFKPITVATRI